MGPESARLRLAHDVIVPPMLAKPRWDVPFPDLDDLRPLHGPLIYEIDPTCVTVHPAKERSCSRLPTLALPPPLQLPSHSDVTGDRPLFSSRPPDPATVGIGG